MHIDLITLLNQKQYPDEYSLANPLGDLLVRGFDQIISGSEKWMRFAGPEAAAKFLGQHQVVPVSATLNVGSVVSSSYALSKDETEDADCSCNYDAFVSSMMKAWVGQKLPNEEIVALLLDARAALDYRHATQGLHREH